MLTTEHNAFCLQVPPTPVAPEGLNNELRSEIESKTVNRLLHLLYFSQVKFKNISRHLCRFCIHRTLPLTSLLYLKTC